MSRAFGEPSLAQFHRQRLADDGGNGLPTRGVRITTDGTIAPPGMFEFTTDPLTPGASTANIEPHAAFDGQNHLVVYSYVDYDTV